MWTRRLGKFRKTRRKVRTRTNIQQDFCGNGKKITGLLCGAIFLIHLSGAVVLIFPCRLRLNCALGSNLWNQTEVALLPDDWSREWKL